MVESLFVLDNGAKNIKAEFSTAGKPKILPNYLVKLRNANKKRYMNLQALSTADRTSMTFYSPIENGYLSDFDVQSQIWRYVLDGDEFNIDPSQTNILITEPMNNPKKCASKFFDILFRQFGFKSVALMTNCHLSALRYMDLDNPATTECVIVDTGHSFTHIVPFVNGMPFREAQIRIDVGGRHLTDQLKSTISFRQLDLSKETYLVDDIKEKSSFVALDFKKLACNSAAVQADHSLIYTIPDLINQFEGTVEKISSNSERPLDRQSLNQRVLLDVERFTIPEMIFQPSLFGVNQIGLSEAIAKSISRCPSDKQANLYANIVLTGGNANIAGFPDRLTTDLRSLSNYKFVVCVFKPDVPDEYSWTGGRLLSNSTLLTNKMIFIRKVDYLEKGWAVCGRP